MSRSFAAALRRASRLMRPPKLTKASRSIGRAMTSLMVKSALASFAAAKPTKARSRKAAVPKAGQTLGAVLTQLKAVQSVMLGAPLRATKRTASPRIPKGAQYLAASHRSAAGSRDYKLYLPASHPDRPKGLILMLHGCNQTPDDFALGTHMNAVAEKHGLAVVYPAQTGRNNAARCWNWFKPVNQRRGRGEPEILASLTRKLMKRHNLRREAVFVAGLSAGGAMAAILADVYPDLFSAAGIHSGLARGAAYSVRSAISAMHSGGIPQDDALPPPSVRRIVFQGDADRTVHPSNAAQIVQAAIGDTASPAKTLNRSVRGRGYARNDFAGPDSMVVLELWMLEGAGHAWSGGHATGSYTDSAGPDASTQMVRFFLTKPE